MLVSGLAGYLFYIISSERKTPSAAQSVFVGAAELRDSERQSLAFSVLLVILGFSITILGARFLVNGAIDIAKTIGVSETLIGLTIVAVGTSLPELVTSIIAILRKQKDVALGNIIGSNIFNILGILGITAVVQPLQVPDEILKLDIWVMSVATILLLLFARTGWRIGRREGAILFSLYLIYLSVLVCNA
jgi:cation:H+ antiporter